MVERTVQESYPVFVSRIAETGRSEYGSRATGRHHQRRPVFAGQRNVEQCGRTETNQEMRKRLV